MKEVEVLLGVAPGEAWERRAMRAAIVLAGLLAERSKSPMSYSQLVSKAAALAAALEREVK